MTCLSEFTCSVYADGELGAAETQQVEAHLAVCPRCQALVGSLRAENQLIAQVLADEELALTPARARRWPVLVAGAAALTAGLAALRAALDWFPAWRPPAGLEWLYPFGWKVPVTLSFYVFKQLVEEGSNMLASIVTAAGAFSLVVLFAVLAGLLIKRYPRIAAGLVAVLLAVGIATPASAMEMRKGEFITVRQGETLDDSLFATGNNVEVDGTVTGNVYFFGRFANIRGTVKGDVICFCQSLTVEGTVGGNVFSFSQSAWDRGHVMGSAIHFGQSLHLDSAGRVDGDMVTFGNEARIDGTVGHDAAFFGDSTVVRANIGRNLAAFGNEVNVLGTARIGGKFDAWVKNKAHVRIDPNTTMVGNREIHVKAEPSRYLTRSFYLWRAMGIVGALVVGLLLAGLFGARFFSVAEPRTAGELFQRLGVGFLVLVAVPVAAVIVGITLIGLPLSLMAIALWLVALYTAKIFVAAWVGTNLVAVRAGNRDLARSGSEVRSLVLPLLVGLIIVYVAVYLPYIGPILHFVILLLGLGLAFLRARELCRRPVPA